MWYEYRQHRISEFWFVYQVSGRGVDLDEAFASFDAIYYYWKQLDNRQENQDTRCRRGFTCTWQGDCIGVHYVRRAAFRNCRLITDELLDLPRRSQSGRLVPRFTEERIEICRMVKSLEVARFNHPTGWNRADELDYRSFVEELTAA